jgi:hypothetical protein
LDWSFTGKQAMINRLPIEKPRVRFGTGGEVVSHPADQNWADFAKRNL